ncbi:MAG: hypothetical protein WDN04_09790 [Rhodospirillales bacterium]
MVDAALLTKLQVKRERCLAVLHAPAGFDPGATVPPTEADVVLLFTPTRAALTAVLGGLAVKQGAILWVAYPKLTSRLAGDLHRDIIAALVPEYGYEVVAAIAIDADWSGLRLKPVA